MQQIGDEFIYPVSVYYQDTDAGGGVYHGSYLRFMERARTEWLRHIGYEQQRLMDESNIIFMVRHAEIDYLAPARLDDKLIIHNRLIQLGKASFTYQQNIQLDGVIICQGMIKIACVSTVKERPTAIPTKIFQALQHCLYDA